MTVFRRLLSASFLLAFLTEARGQCDDEIAACTADAACTDCYHARSSSNQPEWLQCMTLYEDDTETGGVCAALKIACCLHQLSLPGLSCMANGAFIAYAQCVAAITSAQECPANWSCDGIEVDVIGGGVTPAPEAAPTLQPTLAIETPAPTILTTSAVTLAPTVPETLLPVAPTTPSPGGVVITPPPALETATTSSSASSSSPVVSAVGDSSSSPNTTTGGESTAESSSSTAGASASSSSSASVVAVSSSGSSSETSFVETLDRTFSNSLSEAATVGPGSNRNDRGRVKTASASENKTGGSGSGGGGNPNVGGDKAGSTNSNDGGGDGGETAVGEKPDED
eukprot:g2544.t1